MHIQAYLDIYHYSYNNINFLFFTLILYTFQRNLKGYVFFSTMTSISILNLVDLYNARSLKIALK